MSLARPHDDVSRARAVTLDNEGVVESVAWDKLLPPVTLPSETIQQVERVMQPRFGYKPEVLFVYALDEWDNHAWEDGLSRALRELRRHFHMTFMNIGHLRIEEQPEIDFQMKNTFHFFLGYGRFLGHADFFMRKYNEVINPVKKQKGEQLVTFALMLRGGQHFPDDEALNLYGSFITETPMQADELRQEHPDIADRVFHGIGIDPQHWTQPVEGPAKQGRDGEKEYDVLVLGDLTSATRPELLIEKRGRRMFVGRTVDASSGDIREELRAAGVQVSAWVNASERARLYRSASLIYFPMSDEGAGEVRTGLVCFLATCLWRAC